MLPTRLACVPQIEMSPFLPFRNVLPSGSGGGKTYFPLSGGGEELPSLPRY